MPFESPAKKFTPVEQTQILQIPDTEEVIELGDADIETEEDGDGRAKKVTRVPEGIRLEMLEAETQFQVNASTEASPDHPNRNEDNHFFSAERGLMGLFDGMGGVPAGDFASSYAGKQLTKEAINAHLDQSKTPEEIRTAGLIKKVFDSSRDTTLRQEDVELAMKEILVRMNDEVEAIGTHPEIKRKAVEYFNKEVGKFSSKNPEHLKMLERVIGSIGSTASILKTWKDQEGKDHVTVGNVGDSRIYRLRNGELQQLTRDDSHVQILIEEGLIQDDEDVEQEIEKSKIVELAGKRKELAPLVIRMIRTPGTKIKIGDFRNMILQGIGIRKMAQKEFGIEFTPNITTYDLESEDLLIDVSDGVSDNLTNKEIQEIATQYQNQPARISAELQKAATSRSIQGKTHHVRAKKDDVTAVVAKFIRTR